MRINKTHIGVGLAVAGLALLTACTSSSGSPAQSSPAGNPSSSESNSSAASPTTSANAGVLAAALQGTFATPPTSGPAASSGKKVWVLSCGQLSTSCNVPSAALMDAGRTIGWKMNLYDGKLNPALFASGVSQAIAAGANGIILVGIDCDTAQVPLRQAAAAGVKIVGFLAFDCSDPMAGEGKSTFSTSILFAGGKTQADFLKAWGAAKASWLIGQSNGHAKVLDITAPAFVVEKYTDEGFQAQMATCASCSVTSLDLQASDLFGSGALQKVTSALQQHADLTAINVGADPMFQQFVNQAVKAAGRSGLAGMGGECFDVNVAEIRTPGSAESACTVIPEVWMGWATIDELNRQFADPGSAPVDEGLGLQIIDATHNLPTTGGWTSTVPFQADYRKIWGV